MWGWLMACVVWLGFVPGPCAGTSVAWCQAQSVFLIRLTFCCSPTSQVPCWTQTWLQEQERPGLSSHGLKGHQISTNLHTSLPGTRGRAAAQALSLEPREGVFESFMLKVLGQMFWSFRGNWGDQMFLPTLRGE